MSFILDALKKSENDRRKRDTPGIANIPEVSQQKSGAPWIWIIVGLLTVNLIVISALTFRSGSDQEPVALETPSTATESEPAPTTFAEIVSEAKRSQPGIVELDEAAPADKPATVTTNETETKSAALTKPPETPAETVTSGLTTLNELRAQGVVQLPEMHLDIHVYSGQPNNRFVFVNMTKYKEKATLSEGPLVQEITPEGVILEYSGRKFLLPRE